MTNGVRSGITLEAFGCGGTTSSFRVSMSPPRSRGPEPLWQEVLRRAAVTLGGRAVGVWEADARGRLHLLASSSEDLAPLAGELEAALRTLGELPGARPPPCRWVASRLEEQRWCIARVRRELPRPPPPGVERRGRERMALELAGVCIGLLGDPDRQAAGARDVENLARLALTVEQVPAILWTTNAELRITARSGAGLTSDILPERVVGASLLDQFSKQTVSADSINAHRRALAGESVSYQIRLEGCCYDAHVEPLRNKGGGIVGVVGVAVDVRDRAPAPLALKKVHHIERCRAATALEPNLVGDRLTRERPPMRIDRLGAHCLLRELIKEGCAYDTLRQEVRREARARPRRDPQLGVGRPENRGDLFDG